MKKGASHHKWIDPAALGQRCRVWVPENAAHHVARVFSKDLEFSNPKDMTTAIRTAYALMDGAEEVWSVCFGVC